jgi:hypothetical protein
MFEVEDGRQKMRVKRQKEQRQQPTQGKDGLGLKGQQRLKKEKIWFLLTGNLLLPPRDMLEKTLRR